MPNVLKILSMANEKTCPKCGAPVTDYQSFCYECGHNLLAAEFSGNPEKPLIDLGDANAINRLNVDQSRTVTSNDTHYHTTNIERSKSESELRLDAENRLRRAAEAVMESRGRIDSVELAKLKKLATEIGLPDDVFKQIIKESRKMRLSGAPGLSTADERYLSQTQRAIASNDVTELQSLMPRLEAMALTMNQNDDVQFCYHLALCVLDPEKCIKAEDSNADDNYWRKFWSIVSTFRLGNEIEAVRRLTAFRPEVFEKPDDDRYLLEATYNIVNGNNDTAQDFLDEILDGPSPLLSPLHRAVEAIVYGETGATSDIEFHIQHTFNSLSANKSLATATAPTPLLSEPKAPQQPAPAPEKSVADPVEDAVVAPESPSTCNGDELFAQALRADGAKKVELLRQAVDLGHADAMYELGDCYFDGVGVEKDLHAAFKLMQQAADLGHPMAAAALGVAYHDPGEFKNIVTEDEELAEKYLLIAAKSGNSDAQLFLSHLYDNQERYDEAFIYANRAACFGNSDAQLYLGSFYFRGVGVEQDKSKAVELLKEASKQGNAKAMQILAECYLDGDGVEADRDLGLDWMKKAADAGDENAIEYIKNLENSRPQPEESADLDDEAQPVAPIDGFPEIDASEVAEYRSGANNGDVEAMVKLACCYLTGTGVKENDNMAVMWAKRAADLDNVFAAFLLGYRYLEPSTGLSPNFQQAAKWFRKAAAKNHPESMYWLGHLYIVGEGVVANTKKGEDLISQAAALGDPQAIDYLKKNSIETQKGGNQTNSEAKKTELAPEITKYWADNANGTNSIRINVELQNWRKTDSCKVEVIYGRNNIHTIPDMNWKNCWAGTKYSYGFAIAANRIVSKTGSGQHTLKFRLTPKRSGIVYEFRVLVDCKSKIFSKDEVIVLQNK